MTSVRKNNNDLEEEGTDSKNMSLISNSHKNSSDSVSQQRLNVYVQFLPSTLTSEYDPVWYVDKDTGTITGTLQGRTKYEFGRGFVSSKPMPDHMYKQILRPHIARIVSGINGTVIAIGERDGVSAKTRTMFGSRIEGTFAPGISHFAARDIFAIVSRQHRHRLEVQISLTYIVDSQVFDLLSDNCTSAPGQINQNATTNTKSILVGIKQIAVAEYKAFARVLRAGMKQRPQLELTEGPGHTLLSIHVTVFSQKQNNNLPVRSSILNLVELSEPSSFALRKPLNTSGVRIEVPETIKSLAPVDSIVKAIHNKKETIEEPLTCILRESFVGHARVALICCCSSTATHFQETESLLNCAQNVSACSKPTMGIEPVSVEEALLPYPSHDLKQVKNTNQQDVEMSSKRRRSTSGFGENAITQDFKNKHNLSNLNQSQNRNRTSSLYPTDKSSIENNDFALGDKLIINI